MIIELEINNNLYSFCNEGLKLFVSCNWYPNIAGYLIHNADNKTSKSFHRELLKPDAGDQVDHINRNPRDNRLTNLRIVDKSTNYLNRSKNTYGLTSEYRGVSFNKQSQKYTAYVGREYLGRFKTAKAAAIARNNYLIYQGYPTDLLEKIL